MPRLSNASISRLRNLGILILALALTPQIARAQAAAAQAESKTSGTGVAATTDTEKERKPAGTDKDVADKPPAPIMASAAKSSGGSAHIIAPDGPPPEELNRKALEADAGPDAGKLLIRSTPSGAQIFINDAYVGHSPMLLIVPPGDYKIEMRGGRLETGSKTVGLLPNQTQDVALTLKQLYPSQVPMK
jgi:hypothetical protein